MELKELYKIALGALELLTDNPTPDFRLEQVEFMPKSQTWELIVSYLVRNINSNKVFGQNLPFERLYKKIKIDKNNTVSGIFIYEKGKQ